MQGNYCEPARELSVSEKTLGLAKELSVSEKTLELAKDLATLSEEIATRVEHKLSPISWPAPPLPDRLEAGQETWPVYFDSMREQMNRIQTAQRRIETALDRTGI